MNPGLILQVGLTRKIMVLFEFQWKEAVAQCFKEIKPG